MEESHATTVRRHYSTLSNADGSAMSFRALVWVVKLQGVTWAERGVLNKLANHANKDGGSAWPSVRTISQWAAVDERTIRRILNRLLGRGLIEVVGANGRTGGKYPTTYRILIPSDYQPAARQAENPASSVGGRGDILRPRGRTPVSPEPVKKNRSSRITVPVGPTGA